MTQSQILVLCCSVMFGGLLCFLSFFMQVADLNYRSYTTVLEKVFNCIVKTISSQKSNKRSNGRMRNKLQHLNTEQKMLRVLKIM